MKNSIIFTTVITLAVSSQLVFAGEITDTYTAGDTLTAIKMENIKTAVNDNDIRITQTITEVTNSLNELLLNQYVPFKVEISGGICNTAATGSANPRIDIDSNGTDGTFLVNSILLKTNDIPATGFVALSLNNIRINGTTYDTRTANLTGNAGGTGVLESFDILGTPVRLTADHDDHTGGGNVPHQIVANSNDTNDISIQLFCRSDITNLDINIITVSGWKRVSDTISVTYTPGF